MMGPILNRVHRYVGIVVAPFLVVQTLSGLLLSFGLFRRSGSVLTDRGLPLVYQGFERLLAKAHFGPGTVDDLYHLLLGIGTVWMAFSGWLLYLRGRRLRRNTAAALAVGGNR
jgi:uncharacterized iron-regulated membrane protein